MDDDDTITPLLLRCATLLALCGAVGSLAMGRTLTALVLAVVCSLCWLGYCYATAEDMPEVDEPANG